MKKFLYLFFAMLFCLILVSCNKEASKESDDGTYQNTFVNNEIKADSQSSDTVSNNTSIENIEPTTCLMQGCECYKNSSHNALLIAQTHFFETVNTNTDFGWYYLFEIIQEPNIFVEHIEDENWYIMPVLYQNGEKALIDGECQYVYVIKKSTGEISNLLIFAGE